MVKVGIDVDDISRLVTATLPLSMETTSPSIVILSRLCGFYSP